MPDRGPVTILLERKDPTQFGTRSSGYRLIEAFDHHKIDLMPPLSRIPIDGELVADGSQRLAQQHKPLLFNVDDSPSFVYLSTGGPAQVDQEGCGHLRSRFSRRT